MRADTNKQPLKHTHNQRNGTVEMKINNRESEAKQRRGKENTYTLTETTQSNGSKIKNIWRKALRSLRQNTMKLWLEWIHQLHKQNVMIVCRLDFCIFRFSFRFFGYQFSFMLPPPQKKLTKKKISIWFIRRCRPVFIFKIQQKQILKFRPNYRLITPSSTTAMTDVYKRIGTFKVYCRKRTNKIPVQMGRARTKNASFATFPFKLRFFFRSTRIRFISSAVCLLFAQFLTRSPIARKYRLHVSALVLFVDCFIASQPIDSALYLCILKRRALRERKRKKSSNYRVQSHEILLMRISYSLCAGPLLPCAVSLAALGVRWQCVTLKN